MLYLGKLASGGLNLPGRLMAGTQITHKFLVYPAEMIDEMAMEEPIDLTQEDAGEPQACQALLSRFLVCWHVVRNSL